MSVDPPGDHDTMIIESRRGLGRRLLAVLLPLTLAACTPAATPTAYPTAGVPSGHSILSTKSAAPTGPFAGTPAETYAKGSAGISLPAARAVTGFSAAEVDKALRQVRRALVAGRLDNAMLVSHRPAIFLALLAPTERKHVEKWFRETSYLNVATWIDPAVRLDPKEQPRVSGRVTYSSVKANGLRTLRITTNFVWVYAFTSGNRPIAAVHDEVQWDFPDPGRVRAADRGMWIGNTRSYSAWVDCDAARRGLIAPGKRTTDPVPHPSATEDPDSYMRADHALDIAEDC
jgi:hypothetical protein